MPQPKSLQILLRDEGACAQVTPTTETQLELEPPIVRSPEYHHPTSESDPSPNQRQISLEKRGRPPLRGGARVNSSQRKRDSQKKKKKRHSQLQYAKPFAIRHPVARHRSLISISNRRDKFGANRSVFDNFGAQSQHLHRNLVL